MSSWWSSRTQTTANRFPYGRVGANPTELFQ